MDGREAGCRAARSLPCRTLNQIKLNFFSPFIKTTSHNSNAWERRGQSITVVGWAVRWPRKMDGWTHANTPTRTPDSASTLEARAARMRPGSCWCKSHDLWCLRATSWGVSVSLVYHRCIIGVLWFDTGGGFRRWSSEGRMPAQSVPITGVSSTCCLNFLRR